MTFESKDSKDGQKNDIDRMLCSFSAATMMMVSRLSALCKAQRRFYHGSTVSLYQRLNGVPSVVEDNTELEAEFIQGEVRLLTPRAGCLRCPSLIFVSSFSIDSRHGSQSTSGSSRGCNFNSL